MSQSKTTVLTGWLQKAQQFFFEIPAEALMGRAATHKLQRAGVFCYMVVRGFVDNRCPMRAAALTYTMLLALVPLLVVALSVSKNLLRDASAEVVPQLLDKAVAMVVPQLNYVPLAESEFGPPAPGQAVMSSQARQEVVAKIQSFIDGIDAGKLGVIGSFFLVIVALRMMVTVENTFNDIWGITRGRTFWRKIVYYWTTITLGPLLLVLAVTLTGKLEYARQAGELLVAPWLEHFFWNLLPFVVLWVAFSLMYALMPNTRVRLVAAVAGGVVAGTLWQLNSLLSTLYLSRVVTYSNIYGGLGIIPVLLVGLYFSWLITLLGAQVSYAAQNIHLYLQRRLSDRMDEWQRELTACRIMLEACARFLAGQPPPTTETIARQYNAPASLLNQLVQRLTEAGLIAEVTNGAETGLQPARPPETITVADVLRVVRTNAATTANDAGGSDLMARVLAELHAAEQATPANASFRELSQRSLAAAG